MVQIRKSAERGHLDHGWLDTYHTFSFGSYYSPANMGFRTLRVMNEDRVEPGEGFGMHPHRDMEIVTIVLSGALEHKDSLGNGAVLRPGEVQRITAGTGIEHSEFNPSETEPVHLYQIWLLPSERGLTPGYEQRAIAPVEAGAWRLAASPDGRDGSLTIHQDAKLLLARIDEGQNIAYELPPRRHGWLQVLSGAVELGGERLTSGDGAAISEQQSLDVLARQPSEVLLFDLA